MDKVKKKAEASCGEAKSLGRKRDPQLDETFLAATLDVLAEKGFDAMTVDMVAAQAKSGKASLYRRWASKPELVRDALIFMSRGSVETTQLPDTGSLRSDLLAILKPYSAEHNARKLRILTNLGSFQTAHKAFSDEAIHGIFKPWVEMNQKIFYRAQERGEIARDADIDLACEIISSSTYFKTSVEGTGFPRAYYERLLDHMILPAFQRPGS
jgi:AcrR family transcriptional regulator